MDVTERLRHVKREFRISLATTVNFLSSGLNNKITAMRSDGGV